MNMILRTIKGIYYATQTDGFTANEIKQQRFNIKSYDWFPVFCPPNYMVIQSTIRHSITPSYSVFTLQDYQSPLGRCFLPGDLSSGKIDY
jgi:hypothetical protein